MLARKLTLINTPFSVAGFNDRQLNLVSLISMLIMFAATSWYFFCTYKYAIAVPFSDDFGQQLGLVMDYKNSGNSGLGFLFRQHNEHRLFTTYLWTLIDFETTGKVHLNWQLLPANLSLLALALSFCYWAPNGQRLFILALSSLMLFSIEASSTWVGGTTQYFSVILFGLWALYFVTLRASPLSVAASLLCFFLSLNSMFGGILVAVVGLCYLLLFRRSQPKLVVAWSIGAACIIVIFFNGYLSTSSHNSLFYFFENPVFSLKFTAVFLGNIFARLLDTPAAYAAALVFVTTLCYLVYSGWKKTSLLASPACLFIVFLLLLCASIVAGRVNFEILGMASSARYLVITKALWISALIALTQLHRLSSSAQLTLLLLFAVYYFANTQQGMHILEVKQSRQSNAMIDCLYRGNARGFEYAGGLGDPGTLIRSAISNGVYDPEILESKGRFVDLPDGLGLSKQIDSQTIRHGHRFGYFYVTQTIEMSGQPEQRVRLLFVPQEDSDAEAQEFDMSSIEMSRLNYGEQQAAKSQTFDSIIHESRLREKVNYDLYIKVDNKIAPLNLTFYRDA